MDDAPPGSIRQQLGQLEEELSVYALQEDNVRYAAANQELHERLIAAEDALGEARLALSRTQATIESRSAPLRRWRIGAILAGLAALGFLTLTLALFAGRARLEGRIAEQQQNVSALQSSQSATVQELARAREQVGSTSSEVGALNARLSQLEAERDDARQRVAALEEEKGLILAERELLRKKADERQKILDARDAKASGKTL